MASTETQDLAKAQDVPEYETEGEDWEGDDYEDDEDDGDIDAEAQEITRRLEAELAAMGALPESEDPEIPETHIPDGFAPEPPSTPPPHTVPPTAIDLSRSRELVSTLSTIVSLVQRDPIIRSAFSTTHVPVVPGGSVLSVFADIIASGSVGKGVALSLSQIVLSLAQSDSLFGHRPPPPERPKRKRDERENIAPINPRPNKRQVVSQGHLAEQLSDAIAVVANVINADPSTPLDPTSVASMSSQLHQIFLFSVTSLGSAGSNAPTLQEISGLIQIIGLLSGIQIGQNSAQPPAQPQPYATSTLASWSQPTPSTPYIGTAVYPCTINGCPKIFSRLFSLRTHQRAHFAERPFRCTLCPASFARNHDLKRHCKLHDRTAWKCACCEKIFSRRDALKRHRDVARGRGSGCGAAPVTEVALDGERERGTREERRAKLWHGVGNGEPPPVDNHGLEEGEVLPEVILMIQAAVLGLHAPLLARARSALGTAAVSTIGPDGEQQQAPATWATVFARAFAPRPAEAPTLPTQLAQPMLPAAQLEPAAPSAEHAAASAIIGDEVLASLPMIGLTDEQTRLLEEAIAHAASAAQAQAEAEADMEENAEDSDSDDPEDEDALPAGNTPQDAPPATPSVVVVPNNASSS
ncbi:hypothetical protein BD626DRAFT_533594 [Schizophyllum amplum]|uniref:C2H2-type domain-containing protein n=1 Tax=Schizophyllum amplum TaxID=97359 RepID=A0A550CZN9_9AGAR|nr:hypothetical protein BD626DRAFT_533594 [Auriculariopsis ampla]